MKNLDQLGVQEMNVKEMKEENGGIWYILLGAAIGALMSQDLDAMADAYNEGFEAGQN